MWELVALCGEVPTRELSFPISETREKLEKVIENGRIKSLGSDIVDLFLDTIKPYKGGNDPLCALHDLERVMHFTKPGA